MSDLWIATKHWAGISALILMFWGGFSLFKHLWQGTVERGMDDALDECLEGWAWAIQRGWRPTPKNDKRPSVNSPKTKGNPPEDTVAPTTTPSSPLTLSGGDFDISKEMTRVRAWASVNRGRQAFDNSMMREDVSTMINTNYSGICSGCGRVLKNETAVICIPRKQEGQQEVEEKDQKPFCLNCF